MAQVIMNIKREIIDLLRNNLLLQFPYFGQIFQKFSWLSVG